MEAPAGDRIWKWVNLRINILCDGNMVGCGCWGVGRWKVGSVDTWKVVSVDTWRVGVVDMRRLRRGFLLYAN